MSYKFRLMKNCGDHALPNGKTITQGQVFSSTEPLHEKHANKFELLSGTAVEEAEEEDTDDLVDKSHVFPLAGEKGLEVWRSRTTKEYEIHDAATEEPVEGGTGLTREGVEDFLSPKEEVVVKTKKKKKKNGK